MAQAKSSPTSPADVEHEVHSPTEGAAGGMHPVQPKGSDKGGKPDETKIASLEELQNKVCPNCTTGVLYVVRYDPNALHEDGQQTGHGTSPAALPVGYESGGAYEVKCAQCHWSASYAVNPGKHYGKGR